MNNADYGKIAPGRPCTAGVAGGSRNSVYGSTGIRAVATTAFIALLIAFAPSAIADELSDLKETIKKLEARLQVLESERAVAKVAPVPATAPASATAPAPATTAVPPITSTTPAIATSTGSPVSELGAPVISVSTRAEDASVPDANKARIEIYGQVMLDGIYDFKRMNPDWNATERPSQIPVVCPGSPGCGKDGAWIFSARQSSLGARSFIPTSWGLIKTDLSFDLFGTDGDTAVHWLSIWAELGMFGVGQTYSNFMDIDVFPNTIDYWGPSGMVFVRNPQLRVTPWSRDGMSVAFSLEAPNSALDTGKITEISPDFGAGFEGWNRLPDLTGSFRMGGDRGHVRVAGIVRQVGFQNTLTPDGNPSGTKTGYGLNLTGTLKVLGDDQLNAGVVWGRGIASYMNDGGVDLAPGANLRAEAVESFGWLAYYNHYWTEKWSSAIGFSQHTQDNTEGQTATAFKRGSYGNVNLLWTPWKNVLTGLEFVWGELEQMDGQSATDYRLQYSTKVTF